jgi:uncharacterized protein (DUF302 family)
MHFLSKCVSISFADAVGATKDALKRQKFSILAEIDMRQVLGNDHSVDFRPYLILNACILPLAQRAIETDHAIASLLLCEVVIQEHRDGHVEISVVDPTSTIGTINHVELVSFAQELQSRTRQLMDDIDAAPEFCRAA